MPVGNAQNNGLTEGHLREEMVHDVVVRDVVQEELARAPEELPVHRRRRAAPVRPRAAAVERNRGVGVLQEGDRDDPVVNEEPRDAVVLHHVPEAVGLCGAREGNKHADHRNVGIDDQNTLALGEERGVGWRQAVRQKSEKILLVLTVEMACSLGILWVTALIEG